MVVGVGYVHNPYTLNVLEPPTSIFSDGDFLEKARAISVVCRAVVTTRADWERVQREIDAVRQQYGFRGDDILRTRVLYSAANRTNLGTLAKIARSIHFIQELGKEKKFADALQVYRAASTSGYADQNTFDVYMDTLLCEMSDAQNSKELLRMRDVLQRAYDVRDTAMYCEAWTLKIVEVCSRIQRIWESDTSTSQRFL